MNNRIGKLIKGVAILLGFSLIFTSCRKDDESANITPKEALVNFASNKDCQMVVSLRVGDLLKKSGLEDDLLPVEMKMMADNFLSQYLDPKETGIDLGSTAYIFGDLKGIPKTPEFFTLLVALTDGDTFGAFLEGQTHMAPESGDGYKYVSLPNGKGAIAWNNGFAAVMMGHKFEKGDSKDVIEDMMAAMSKKGKKKTERIAKFADHKGDIGFFMDYAKYMKVMPKNPETDMMMGTDMMKKMMKDFYVSGFISFENGKIEADYEMDVNNDMEDFMKKVYRNGNPEFANYLGGEDLIGYVTSSFNIDEILNYYEKIGFFDMPVVSEGLVKFKMLTGLSVRDLANKFSGDGSFGFVGITEDTGDVEAAEVDENEYSGFYEKRKSTKPVFTMAIGIRDSMMTKIFDTIPTLKKERNMYKFEGVGGLCVKNNVLFLTSDPLLLSDFAADGKLTTYTKNNAQKLISSNAIAGYFDFDALTKAMMSVNPEVAEALAVLDHAEMTVSTNTGMKAILYLKNKSENSLKTIGKMIISSASKSGAMF